MISLHMQNKLRRYDLIIIAAAFLILLPIFSVQRTTDFIIFCIFVIAYDLLYGYMGRLSFGHMLYLGTGAYAAAMTVQYVSENPFIVMIFSIAAGIMVGVLLGPIIIMDHGSLFRSHKPSV